MKQVNDLNFWETVKDIPNRVITLFWKLLSVKGVALGLATWLILRGSITDWQAVTLFLVTVLMVIGGREASKWFDRFKELKE